MAHQLAALGVDVLEAGFAIASQGDLESIRTIAREVRGPRIASLARCKREDIEAAARAVEPAASSRIHVFLASSDLHLEAKLRITRAQALEQAAGFRGAGTQVLLTMSSFRPRMRRALIRTF